MSLIFASRWENGYNAAMPRRQQHGRCVLIGLLWIAAGGTGSAAGTLDLLPHPARVVETGGRFLLDETFTVAAVGEPGDRARRAAVRFLDRFCGRTGLFVRRDGNPSDEGDPRASFIYKCERLGSLVPGEDESYRITVSPDRVLLVAPTDLGLLRGFETVLQLVEGGPEGYVLPCVQVEDEPRFTWRGLLLDSGRHFLPVEVVRRNLDGMAAVKMNVLHWHLTEDQGFRVESKLFPGLHQLGSDGLYYTQAEIRDLVAYAADRGIRVMPEFDLPGHATSWFAAYPELAGAPGPYRVSRTFGVQLTVFNPANPNVYAFLDAFLGEMTGLFPDAYVHLGGDESNGMHWDRNPEIQEFKREKGLASNEELQAYFTARLLEILKRHGRRMAGWEEILQPGLSGEVVIQSWRGTGALIAAARKGYTGLLSHGYYLDLCQPASDHYLNDPLPEGHGLTPEEAGRILGGEAAMWSGLVSPETIDSRIWPRTAAIAERLWSRRGVRDVDDMYRRLETVSCALEEHGLTHLKNRDMMLRRLAGAMDIGPLCVLAEAVEPLEGYRRQSLGRVKTTLDPLTRFVDAVPPESGLVRRFAASVGAFLSGNDPAASAFLRRTLELWRDNHESAKPHFLDAPALREVEPLSRGLAEAAEIGLQAMETMIAGRKAGPSRGSGLRAALEDLKKPFIGELELAAVPAIERLAAAAEKSAGKPARRTS
ncbi:MAG: family 20 glycosylhydrolase [Candidatus Aminicenantes bacterium]|nr:family 20 glycosylhydrolase [Candidatus Aminicenantes bacterium]